MSQAKSPAAAATASPAAPASTPADRAAADRAQAQQLLDKAIALIKAQKLDEAEGVLGDLMSRHPGEPEVWYNAGGVAKLRKETERAVQRMRKAVSLAPTVAKYRHDLGRLLFELGRIDEAAVTLKAATRPGPMHAKQLSLLGIVLTRRKEWEEALLAFDAAIAADPADPDTHSHKAATLYSLGRKDEATLVMGEALRKNSDNIPVLRTLVHIAARQGGFQALPERLKDISATAKTPLNVMKELSRQFFELNEVNIAHACSAEAFRLAPDDASVVMNLGVMNRRLGNLKAAAELFEKGVKLDPKNPVAWNNLGNIASDVGNKPKAEEAYRKALEIDPEMMLAASNICRVLLESGKTDEAAEIAAKLLRKPNLPASLMPFPLSVAQNVADFETAGIVHKRLWEAMDTIPSDRIDAILLSLLPHVRTEEDYKQLFRQQCRWGDHVQVMADRDPLPGAKPRQKRARGPADRLKVGFLSSDLRSHNVAKFLMPIFQHYDKSKIELICISSWPGAIDHVMKEIIRLTDKFLHVGTIPLKQSGIMTRQQGLDIVIEFNGITRYSMAKSLAQRLAPIQVEWLGYPFTLGMAECDYMMVDPYMKPTTTACMRDKALELPKSWIVFDPDDQFGIGFGAVPVEAKPPLDKNGFVMFGISNKPYKYTDVCFAGWCRVLKAVKGSKLMVLRPESSSAVFRANMLQNFARHGIGEDRIVFQSNPPGQHMALYNLMDIALDTYPQVGGTTTTESLWMGVPTISLYAREIFERMGLSILTNVGVPDLAVPSVDAYVETAAKLAEDKATIRALKKDLRTMVRASPMCRKEEFTRDWETTLLKAAG